MQESGPRTRYKFPMGSGSSVLVADDNVLVRDLLEAVLSGTEDFAIVAYEQDADGDAACERERGEQASHRALLRTSAQGCAGRGASRLRNSRLGE